MDDSVWDTQWRTFVAFAREGHTDERDEIMREIASGAALHPEVIRWMRDRVAMIVNGEDPRAAFPRLRKRSDIEKKSEAWSVALGVEEVKRQSVTEMAAIIAVAERWGMTEAKVKSLHQELRSQAKWWVANRNALYAEAENLDLIEMAYEELYPIFPATVIG